MIKLKKWSVIFECDFVQKFFVLSLSQNVFTVFTGVCSRFIILRSRVQLPISLPPKPLINQGFLFFKVSKLMKFNIWSRFWSRFSYSNFNFFHKQKALL